MTKIILSALVAVLCTAPAFADNLGDAQLRELNKVAVSSVVFSTSVFMNITYVGSSTQCVVGISSGDFKTFVPGPDATADLAYSLSATAYDTMGELCDAIDTDDDYTCTLIGAKRNDLSVLTKNVTAAVAVDAKLAGGYDVKIDTGAVDVTTDAPQKIRLGVVPRSGKRVVLRYCTANINVADTLFVSGKLARYMGVEDGIIRNANTVVYSAITADDTDKTIGDVYGSDWLEFGKDEHVIIGNVGAGVQQSANFITCFWNEK